MKTLEQYLEEARLEAEDRKKQDVFLGVIDRARVAQANRVKEDPMLMWNIAANGKKVYKLYDAENPGVIHTVEQPKQDTFGDGFLSGIGFALMFIFMVVAVWWCL